MTVKSCGVKLLLARTVRELGSAQPASAVNGYAMAVTCGLSKGFAGYNIGRPLVYK